MESETTKEKVDEICNQFDLAQKEFTDALQTQQQQKRRTLEDRCDRD